MTFKRLTLAALCAAPLIALAAPGHTAEQITNSYNSGMITSNDRCAAVITRRDNGSLHVTTVNNIGTIQDKNLVEIVLQNPNSTLGDLDHRRIGVRNCGTGCTTMQVVYGSASRAVFCNDPNGCNRALLGSGQTFDPSGNCQIVAATCNAAVLPAGCTFASAAPQCTIHCPGGGVTPPVGTITPVGTEPPVTTDPAVITGVSSATVSTINATTEPAP
jgi:hypothetical protein